MFPIIFVTFIASLFAFFKPLMDKGKICFTIVFDILVLIIYSG